MEKVTAAKEGATKVWSVAKANPSRTMRVLSSVSGALLILGGIAGALSIFNPLGAVLSIYNILFGLLIVITELKSWPIISTFQKRVDVYFHLLSVPRGKGGFYCFIGFLAFCSSNTFDLARICVLIVTIVGVLHLLPCCKKHVEADPEDGMPGMSGKDGLMPMQGDDSISASAFVASSGLADFAMQVAKDNPEMLKATMDFATSNPEMAAQGAAAAAQHY